MSEPNDPKLNAVMAALDAYSREEIDRLRPEHINMGIRLAHQVLVDEAISLVGEDGKDIAAANEHFEKFRHAMDHMRSKWPWLTEKE